MIPLKQMLLVQPSGNIVLQKTRYMCMRFLPFPQKNLFSLMQFCSGALKSNLGHLEGGSGIAGLIKTIMVLEKGIIPPNANFERLNPRIDAEFSNIKVTTSLNMSRNM